MNPAQVSPPSAAAPISRRKRIFFSILTIGLLVLFAEASLHGFYRLSVGRWLWEWWAIPIYETDPVRVYRVKAKLDYLHKTSEFTAHYCTDDSGMRMECGGKGPSMTKPENTFRILAFGPSFTFGWGVDYDECYMQRLAKNLRVAGKRVELINLGTPSQPYPYQLKWLKAVGHRYHSDLIVQTVYGDIQHIDADDTLPPNPPYVRDGYLHLSQQTMVSRCVANVRRYSSILFYGWHVYHAAMKSRIEQAEGREFYKTVSTNDSADEVLRGYKRYVDFVRAAAANKPQIVFLFVPASHVVRPSDITRVVHRGWAVSPSEARELATSVTSMLRSNHVNMINSTDALVENDKATRMYNLYDIHFTRAGNKVVADYALPLIQDAVNRSAHENTAN